MKSFLTLTLSTALAGLSSAATIVQTENFSFVPNGNRTLNFDKFDTTFGTLTSVTVSVDMTKSGGRFEIDNDSDTAGTIDLTHSVIGLLSSTDVSLRKAGGGIVFVGQSGSITAVNSLTGQTVDVSSGDSITSFNATGNADYVLFQPANTSASDSGNIRSADITDYTSVGASTFNIKFDATQTVSATGLSGLQQAFTVSGVSGNVTVTYNYIAAIPEPTGSLLGALGFLTLLHRRRR